MRILRGFLCDLHHCTRKGSIVPERNSLGGITCVPRPRVYADADGDSTEDEYVSSSLVHRSFLLSSEDRQRLGDNTLPNGDIYVGSWKAGHPDGRGKYLWLDGCMYEGDWSKGKTNGRGKMMWPSGATYEGEFLDGCMHGVGTFTSIEADTYKGNWRMNEKHGFGRQCYRNGDVYEGSWKHGIREGPGKYTWHNGSEYMGEWKDGLMSGRGSVTWPNGDKYNGLWLGGFGNGEGVYTWADGSTYIGTWRRGLKDGKGTYYPPDSRLLEFAMPSSTNSSTSQGCSELSSKARGLSSWDGELDMMNQWKCCHFHGCFVQKVMSGGVVFADCANQLNTDLSHDDRRVCKDVLGRCPPLLQGGRRCNPGFFYNRDVSNQPIVERVYAQGVLINELLKANVPSVLPRPEKGVFYRCPVEEPRKPGQTVCRGHRSYELMLNLQMGIRYTVGKITPEPRQNLCTADFGWRARIRMSFPRGGSQLTPPHQSTDFKWKDYCSVVFRHLRELFKIDAADYMLSICGNDALRELPSPGKSGSVFYLSQDDRFIIKTLRKAEVKVLLGMLPNYYKHVRSSENTLVTKFFGLHSIKSAGQKVRFVVMGNVLCTELCIHRRFDLKGSSQGRFADKALINDNVTTLKDLDLDFVFHLEPSWRGALLKQIVHDCQFLESERIMDYSLLLGLHFRAPGFPTVFSRKVSCSPMHDHRMGSTARVGELGFVGTANSKGFADAVQAHDNDGDAILPLGGTARLQIELGVNMPARANRRQQRGDEDDDDSQQEVYDVVLYLGIIDILQEYDISKKLEHAYKSMHFDSQSISAVDPSLYSKRFQDLIYRIFPASPASI